MLPKLGLKMAKKPTWAGIIAGEDGAFVDEAAIMTPCHAFMYFLFSLVGCEMRGDALL